MGHLVLPLGHGFDPVASDGPGCRLAVLLDRGAGQVKRLDIELPPAWGRPEIAHMVLTQMLRTRDRMEIRDVHGEVRPFAGRAVVRLYVMVAEAARTE